jgi:hypothetical protein
MSGAVPDKNNLHCNNRKHDMRDDKRLYDRFRRTYRSSVATVNAVPRRDVRGRVVPTRADGNCLFHAIASYVYSDLYEGSKTLCARCLRREYAHFLSTVDRDAVWTNDESIAFWIGQNEWGMDYDTYVAHIARDGTWGGALDIAMMAHMLGRCIRVVSTKEGRGDDGDDTFAVMAVFESSEHSRPWDVHYNYHEGGNHYSRFEVSSSSSSE